MTSRPSSPRWLRIAAVTVSLAAVTAVVVWSQTRHHTPTPAPIPIADPRPSVPAPAPAASVEAPAPAPAPAPAAATVQAPAPAPAPAAATVQVPAPAPAEPIDRAVYFSSSKSALAPSFDPPAAATDPDAGAAADVDAR